MEVLQTPRSLGKDRISDKEAESECPLPHTTQTLTTLLRGTRKKPEAYDTQNVQSQAARIPTWAARDSWSIWEGGEQ